MKDFENIQKELEMLKSIQFELDSVETDESDDALFVGYYEQKLKILHAIDDLIFRLEEELPF